MEDQNYNDIRSYVHDELSKISEFDAWPELESDITKKASGSFLWVRLVVPDVIRYALNGESLKSIRYLLAKTPHELGDIYRNTLENVVEARNRHRTLLLMQWICFAERPLSIKELRYAMGSDETCLHLPQRFCEDSEDFVEDGQRMKRQIMALSGGLAEVSSRNLIDEDDESCTTVQFIHQSVNDFLRNRGLDSLFLALQNLDHRDAGPRWTPAAGNIIGQSQDRLSKACLNYLRLDEVVDVITRTEAGMTRDAMISDWGKRSNRNTINHLERKFPFLEYAATCWFLHAEMAERLQIPQDDIIQSFPDDSHPAFQTCRFVFNMFRKHTWQYYPPGAGLLHIASSSNLQTTVRALLSKGRDIEAADEEGLTALHYAVHWGHTGLATILLDAHADIEAASDGVTPLVRAAKRGHEDMVGLLLQRGANVNQSNGYFGNALHLAIRSGKRKVVEILLHGGADMNVRGGMYGSNALQLAIKDAIEYGFIAVDDTIVQLLLDKGADVNAQGGMYGNALQTACLEKRHSTVQLLLDKGADINAQGGLYGNALQAASYVRCKPIVRLLLDGGADVNAQGGEHGNALQAASLRGSNKIVRLLLKMGANINAQGGEHGNALQAACYDGSDENVQLLLNGANVNAQGGKYGNALQAASSKGHDDIVQLLLKNSAHPLTNNCERPEDTGSAEGKLKLVEELPSSEDEE